MRVISKRARFYGYIIGLQIERCPKDGILGRKVCAMFEWSGRISLWAVPEIELFYALAHRLALMAKCRLNTDDYGYEKLWIEKKNGLWIVTTP